MSDLDSKPFPNAFENLKLRLEQKAAAQQLEATRSESPAFKESIKDSRKLPANSSASEDTINRISTRKAAHFKPSSSKQRFSKRINLSASHEHIAAVCDYTGAVVAITFPAIPGKVFSYSSPLADLRNARGLAQEGTSYLRKLDIQTVAAILITLADDYLLFRYQPSDSGAQKNAILRTVAKDILIDAIIFIEDFINSNNCGWVPKLSLILSNEIMQSGVQHRMSEWLKVSLDAVHKPDTESYEEATAVRRTISKPASTASTKRAEVALQKDFRQWKRDSKEIIISLAASSTISAKLKGFLLTLISDQNLMLADSSMIELICEKLRQIEDSRAVILSNNIIAYRVKLASVEDNEFDAPTKDTFASKPVGSAIQPLPEVEDNEFAPALAAPTISVPAVSEAPKLSFKERIALIKAQQQASIPAPKVENDDAPF